MGDIEGIEAASRRDMEASDSDSLSARSAPILDLSQPAAAAGREKPDPPGLGLENDLVRDLLPAHRNKGVLIPLKTTLEVRQDHTLVQAYITRAPTKSASIVVEYVVSPAQAVLFSWRRACY